MAERTIRICDVCMTIDGEGDHPDAVAVRTRDVIRDGQPALLDVCGGHDKEFDELQEKLDAFVRAATPIEVATSKDTRKRSKSGTQENAAIRKWARELGTDIGDRGRISDELRARYLAAVANDQAPAPVE